ncbi:unnamed protein product, partial [marine sediment metagenome]
RDYLASHLGSLPFPLVAAGLSYFFHYLPEAG